MKKILITLIIILCIISGGYFIFSNLESDIYYSDRFPYNTTINGVDCSKMTADEAAAALTEEWNKNHITFKTESEILGSIKLTGVSYDLEDGLKNIRKDYFVNTAMNHVFGTALDLSLPMTVAESGQDFDRSIENAAFLQESDIKRTKDAYIDLNEPEIPIIEEVYGNDIDYTVLKEEIFSLVEDGNFGFQYIKSQFYRQPEITADSEELMERQSFYKEYMNSNISYTMGKDIVKISPADMAKIRGVNLAVSGKLTEDEINDVTKAVSDNVIDEDAVAEYVYSFASKYNTLGSTRTFKTSYGKTIEVEGGAYGFALDQTAETEQLIRDLKSGKTIKRDPIWLMTGFTDYSMKDDIGNTYVEISINKQHLWYYKDGKKIVECDIVTGNPYMGYSTPTGTYGLSYKQYGATLRGEEADGSEYESPVTYWMPFFGNYGMHDATWRYYFGEQIYLGYGSHGCVNMPFDAAEKVFENIADRNVPIVIYDK